MRKYLALSFVALLWTCCSGFINPAFTPIDLVKQSDTILLLKIKNVDKNGLGTVAVQKVIQGELKEKEIKIDFSAATVPAEADAIIDKIKDGTTQAMLFVGKFPEGDDNTKLSTESKGYLHVGGEWVSLLWDEKAGTWDMDKNVDQPMWGTWSGATDMLLRAVNYVLTDPQPNLPVRETIDWATEIKLAKLDGKVYAAAPVDVAATGKSDLFIAAENGDRLFHWNGKSFDDLTASIALTSKSQAFAWGDFNGGGRLDLASWDGKNLTIFYQGKDGKFTGKIVNTGDALKDGCISLTTFDTGIAANKGRPALLASTKSWPVVVTIQDDGSAQVKPLFTGDFPGKNLGDAAECLIADFDNDGIPDLVQLFSEGSLYYKGTKPGEFAAPVRINIGTEAGKHGVCVGDWDGAGLLGIFTCSDQGNHVWSNTGVDGPNRFVDDILLSGSIEHIGRSGGIFAQTVDFNNDGRQGLLVLNAAIYPELYFNRGFRSFGVARGISDEGIKSPPQAREGQQAGCLGNFLGDGPPSMALVLANGEVWFFPRKMDGKALGINICLSLASPNAGPVTVWLVRDQQPFGAEVIRAGDPGWFYGLADPGPVTVKWRFPGADIQQKKMIIDPDAMVVTPQYPNGKPLRLVIDKVQAKAVSNK